LGRSQSVSATPRIYATTGSSGALWLVVSDPKDAKPGRTPDAVAVSTNLSLTMRAPVDRSSLVTPLAAEIQIPDWIKAKVCPPDLIEASQRFSKSLERLETAIGPATGLGDLDRAALRVMIVHGWRRIVLRAPALPDFVYPADWSGDRCRQMVSRHLAQLGQVDLAKLEMAARSD